MKAFAIVILTALALGNAVSARADEARLSPFVAEYEVKYGNMSVGTSRTELTRATAPDQWVIESRSHASGLAKLIYGTLIFRSTFQLDGTNVRPFSYRSDDGTRGSARDVALEFDWQSGHVKGRAEGADVDVAVESGLQDAASLLASVQVQLQRGATPGSIAMIEKDRIKYYRYTLLRSERLTTALGVLDTVVYRSARVGSRRETLTWYAPALDYLPVQVEQRKDGKRLLQSYIRRYQPGA